MHPAEPAGRPAGWTDDEASGAAGHAAPSPELSGAGAPAPEPLEAAAGPAGTLEGAIRAPQAPAAAAGPEDAALAGGHPAAGVPAGSPQGEGLEAATSFPAEPAAVTSPWAGIELPPTATSRRRRKRGHRGGVGRRGGRRVAQPNPEDDPLYPFKVQAAQELGLWPKVEAEGWGALTSLESGRIGGYMQRLLKEAVEEGRLSAEEMQRLLQQRRIRPASTET